MLRSRKFWGTIGVLAILWALANPVEAANGVRGAIDGGGKVGDSVSTLVTEVSKAQ